MKKDFAGKGRKRPQIDIPLANIALDNKNPRLAEEHQGGTQFDILKVLYDEFDLDEIAYSMAENGYFDEEPIVVIPQKFPKNFKWDEDVESLETNLSKLVASDKDFKFIVIEGNRRIASAKLLSDKGLRDKLKIRDNDFPKIKDKTIESDLKIIPAIVYKDRKDISPYLGVRHITGVLKWEAYAKARYIASRIEDELHKGKSIESSIQDVQRKVADRSDLIKRQYMAYKVFEQARDDISFNVDTIINRFSLITVVLNYPSIRDFIGVASYKEVKFNKPLVPKNKLEKLDTLFTWIFGKGKDSPPILTDSRKIQGQLSYILADKDATEYLLQYGNLEEAYERSGGEIEFIKKKINTAKRAVANVLQYAYKHKGDKEIIYLLKELIAAAEELGKALAK
jgi:hypothetical protein